MRKKEDKEEKGGKANREDDEDDEAGAQEGHPRDAQDFHTLGKNKKLVEIWGEGAVGLKWICCKVKRKELCGEKFDAYQFEADFPAVFF